MSYPKLLLGFGSITVLLIILYCWPVDRTPIHIAEKIHHAQPETDHSNITVLSTDAICVAVEWWTDYFDFHQNVENVTYYTLAVKTFIDIMKTELIRQLVNQGNKNVILSTFLGAEGLLKRILVKTSVLTDAKEQFPFLPTPSYINMIIRNDAVLIDDEVIWSGNSLSYPPTNVTTDEDKYGNEFTRAIINGQPIYFSVEDIEEIISPYGRLIGYFNYNNTIFIGAEFQSLYLKYLNEKWLNTNDILWNTKNGIISTCTSPVYFGASQLGRFSLLMMKIFFSPEDREYYYNLQMTRKDIVNLAKHAVRVMNENVIVHSDWNYRNRLTSEENLVERLDNYAYNLFVTGLLPYSIEMYQWP